jgi:Na+-driven multidrug efflux pump
MEASAFFKMDLYFFVTTVVVVIFGILLFVFMLFLIRIVRDIADITTTVKEQAHGIAEDLTVVRTDIKEGVHEMRENVGEGMEAAKTYTRSLAGSGIVSALSTIFKAFNEERQQGRARTRRTRTKRKE